MAEASYNATASSLVKEAQGLPTNVLPSSVLVIHYTSGSCKDNVAKL